jgi:hypothetical protein
MRAGMSVEPDKTELIFFRKCREKVDPPHYIHLPTPSHSTYYRVQATNTLRYLGFFFNTRLTWMYHVEIMCNRAQASLKALQLLRNLVRGLKQAKWRLAYNAICLLVLTYGCQLWYTGKQVTLVRKLQVVQNEVVRIMSGTFRTTPREPLHQLLAVLPMDLCLGMLTQNMALRLYKVPKDSQLLKCIGGEWRTPNQDDLPLPTPNRSSTKMTLCSLTARASAAGPCIEQSPKIPAEAPYWNGHIQITPKQKGWDYHRMTNELTEECRRGSMINIFCDGTISNKGRADGKQIGAASAVLYHNGKDWNHEERVLSETVTEMDVMI